MQKHKRRAVAPGVPDHTPVAARSLVAIGCTLQPVKKDLRINDGGALPSVRAASGVLCSS